jgi:hypothetical protein
MMLSTEYMININRNRDLLVWQVNELCKAFPGRIIDVLAGYHIIDDQLYQEFKDKLLSKGLYVDYDEKHNYHDGRSYDMEDWRIRVSTAVITRPASDFPGGSFNTHNGTDNVLTLEALFAVDCLTMYDTNYVVNTNSIKDSLDLETYMREHAIRKHIAYPLRTFTVCTEHHNTTLDTYNNSDGSVTTIQSHCIHKSAPVCYKAKYTKEELDRLIGDISPFDSTTTTSKRLKRV